MKDFLPDLATLEAAAELVHSIIPPTPQICWPLLCERSGCEVWVKHENHHPVGAFKIRGGLRYINELMREQPQLQGVISATRGNHGQSIALAAKRSNLVAVIVVPHGNSKEKNNAMRALGAELVEYGSDFNEAAEHAQELSEQHGLHMIPSFHPWLIQGVASYWLELFRAVPELDAVYAPIGLGSGICAGIAARNALGLKTRLIGVVSRQAPAYALSFEQEKPVEYRSSTRLADGVAVRKPNLDALELILDGVDHIVQVSDEEVAAAMHAYFTDTHNVAEGAGAAPLAALLQEREKMQGKKAGLILTGGNVDHEIYARVLSD